MISIGILVALSQAEIYNENIVFRVFRSSDQKVVWFNISVDNSFFMNFLDSLEHLDTDQEGSFQIKLTLARLE